jgi:hypothetical protein
MERVLLDEVIHTDYGQFDLVWSDKAGFDGDWDRFFTGQVNGLVGAADAGGVYVNLGRRSGGSRLRIVLLDAEPPLPPPRYEDVVEVSTIVPVRADVRWLSWASQTFGRVDGLVPETYRLRVSAHGRDAGHDGEFAEGMVDEYLLEFWPSRMMADEVLRVGSQDAQYWHQEIGGRR